LPDRADKKGQGNADRATRGRGDLGRSIHVGVVSSGDHAKLAPETSAQAIYRAPATAAGFRSLLLVSVSPVDRY
jgi:hypothetical protein